MNNINGFFLVVVVRGFESLDPKMNFSKHILKYIFRKKNISNWMILNMNFDFQVEHYKTMRSLHIYIL